MASKRCLLCGVEGVRQPVLKSKIVIGYYVPLKLGGKKVQRNMFSVCRYHKKIYEDWGDEHEKAVARKALREHLTFVYPDWSFQDCYKEERSEDN